MEGYALQIASRAHQALDELDKARQMSSEGLAIAQTVRDEPTTALALSNLASITTALGNYPEALRLREWAEAIHRRQGDEVSLPYDLANRADLLYRLGRPDEADAALAEIDVGTAAGKSAYVGRARRVSYLRGFAAAAALRCEDAERRLAALSAGPPDAGSVIGPAIRDFCAARLRRPAIQVDVEGAGPVEARERHYWLAAAALERGDFAAALDTASRGLQALGSLPLDELRWRIAAVGAAAADGQGDQVRRAGMAEIARNVLDKLRADWKAASEKYEKRPDLVYLIRRAKLSRR
jgi:tetratricopeptide (TPR) repeat protein